MQPAPPRPGTPSSTPADVKSNIRKILLANPLFPKFYADVVISSRPNSKLAKVLRAIYPKILDQVKSNMANVQTCTHIKVTGIQCGSPALRGEQFCYFHQRMHRGVRTPPQARLHPIANLEDEESIQSALMEVINALMRNTIDLKRATLILRALHIAVKNAHRVRYGAHSSSMVKEVPDFPASDRPAPDAAEIADAMTIPPGSAGSPARIRTTAELIADGVIQPPAAANSMKSAERIAHYYGYPNAEAHSQALAASKSATGNAAPTECPPDKKPPANVKRSPATDQQGKAQRGNAQRSKG